MAQQSCCYFRRRAGGFLCVTQANLEDFVGDAIATSTNRRLEGAHRRNWWGFAGRRSADAALHARAGAELLRLCHERASELRFGEVLATPAGPRLDAQHVLHTAVPSHPAGRDPRPLPASQAADFVEAPEAAELLRRSYAELLRTAAELGVQSLACPAIGCGCRGYPVREAAEVALRAVGEDAAVPSTAMQLQATFWAWRDRCPEVGLGAEARGAPERGPTRRGSDPFPEVELWFAALGGE
ncbi:unnamed protein product [Prorocentrum cordatum]|uniref:Macro domain-containing protein n=1 Tax=Prorocentrum cordatum TaxID=2364126 RepID=A0ABN9XJZ6_9DINO|nr:unnamed protein product [Polarella glacialis]